MSNHHDALSLQSLSSTDLAHVTGGEGEGGGPPTPGEGGGGGGSAPAQQSWGQTAWQGAKDFTGGLAAGAYSGKQADQPWGNSSSQMSKLGGEMGVMFGGRTGRPR